MSLIRCSYIVGRLVVGSQSRRILLQRYATARRCAPTMAMGPGGPVEAKYGGRFGSAQGGGAVQGHGIHPLPGGHEVEVTLFKAPPASFIARRAARPVSRPCRAAAAATGKPAGAGEMVGGGSTRVVGAIHSRSRAPGPGRRRARARQAVTEAERMDQWLRLRSS